MLSISVYYWFLIIVLTILIFILFEMYIRNKEQQIIQNDQCAGCVFIGYIHRPKDTEGSFYCKKYNTIVSPINKEPYRIPICKYHGSKELA